MHARVIVADHTIHDLAPSVMGQIVTDDPQEFHESVS
jgi:hypothetical protein